MTDADRTAAMGAAVRTLREANGMTRDDLHAKTDISVQMIAKIEQGHKNPSPNSLQRLAGALGMTALDLSRRAASWEVGVEQGLTEAELRLRVLQ